MRFDLTDDQKSLDDMLRGFLADRFGVAEGVEATADIALDGRLWSDIAALGLGGMMVPEAAGGLGLDLLSVAIVAESMGHYAVPAPVVATLLAAWLVAEAGSEDQRARWLPGLLAGDAVASFALAEAGGWLPADWSFEGERLSGTKLHVERAAEAHLLIVGLAGGRLALVDRNDPGITIRAIETLDRSRPLAEVSFDDVPADILASAPVERLIDALLIVHAADALGAASAIQARAVAYACERRQFGQLIGSFQALKHQLADMSVEIEPARALYWYAAHGWDTGRPDAPRMAALVKAHIGEIAVQVGRAAIEAHGGIGYTWEHPAHLFLKRAMHDRTVLGLPSLHRERAAQLAGW